MHGAAHPVQGIAAGARLLHMVLRHTPALISLELDERASVPVSKLIRRAADAGYVLTRSDLHLLVRWTNRYVFVDKAEQNIRAAYGHSIGMRLCSLFGNPQPPSGLLYHGTGSENTAAIRDKGIKGLGRDHVFLTSKLPTAAWYGKRRAQEASIVVVDAARMYRNCRNTYVAHDGTWLVEQVDPSFIVRIVNLGHKPKPGPA
jgi:putative RNA 2'-phosphotransferase